MSTPAAAYAYGVAMGLTTAEWICSDCGAARWEIAEDPGWIECGNCGSPRDALLLIDDATIALALQLVARVGPGPWSADHLPGGSHD